MKAKLLVLVMAVAVCGGCASMQEAWMRGYVAVHDAADAALSNKVDHLPAVTNMVPPTIKPEPAKGCGCDLSLPLCDPPYTGAYLQGRGNAEEVGPTPRGQYWRMPVRYVSHRRTWVICSLMDLAVEGNGNTVKPRCFSKDGYRYHLLGWTMQDNQLWDDSKINKVAPGEVLVNPGSETRWLPFECRKLK